MFNPFYRRYKPRIFYPESYGAIGDGVTDDTVALQVCHDACANFGGGIIYLNPTKIYGVTSAKNLDGTSKALWSNQYQLRFAWNIWGNNITITGGGTVFLLSLPVASSPVVAAFVMIAVGNLTPTSHASLDDEVVCLNTRIINIKTDVEPTISDAQVATMDSGISGHIIFMYCHNFYCGYVESNNGFGHIAILGTHAGSEDFLFEYNTLTARHTFSASDTITNASNTSPIVITTTTATGNPDGNIVTITGVLGNTAANGRWFAKREGSNTFSLYRNAALTVPVSGNGNYISGGTVTGIRKKITNVTNASIAVVTTQEPHSITNGTFILIEGLVGNTSGNGYVYAKTAGYTSTTFALYLDSAMTIPIAGNGTYISGGEIQMTPYLWTTQAGASIELDGGRYGTIQYCDVSYSLNGIGANANADIFRDPQFLILNNNYVHEVLGVSLYISASSQGCQVLDNYTKNVHGAPIGLLLQGLERLESGGSTTHYPCINVIVEDNVFEYIGVGTIHSGIGISLDALASGNANDVKDCIMDNNTFIRLANSFKLNDIKCSNNEASLNVCNGAVELYTGTATPTNNNITAC